MDSSMARQSHIDELMPAAIGKASKDERSRRKCRIEAAVVWIAMIEPELTLALARMQVSAQG
jgi:hypothetical protein